MIFYLPEENTLEKQVQVVQEQRLVRSSIVKNKVSCQVEVIVVIVVSFLL